MPITETSDPITKALHHLKWMQKLANPDIVGAARTLELYFEMSAELEKEGPRPPFIQTAALRSLGEAATALGASKGKDQRYQTNIFKCLADYDKCLKRRPPTFPLCIALAIICIAKQLIPLAPRE